jgi:membrane protease YdiL (CAAX protease family)
MREEISAMSGPQAGLHATEESHKHGGWEHVLRWKPGFDAMQLPCGVDRRQSAFLAAEIVTVTIGTITAIRFLNIQAALGFKWLLIPCLLVVAALLPTWLRNGAFPAVGLDRKHAMASLAAVCLTCLCTIPAVFLGLWLIVRMNLPIPLRPAVAGPDGWLGWLIYQFLYVAVAEELFFRGYFQANVLKLLGGMYPRSHRIPEYVAVIVSAGCFAWAHVVVQGQIISLFTFFPGLILAWLFLRTQSLLAPILFHGLANVAYGVIALTLM